MTGKRLYAEKISVKTLTANCAELQRILSFLRASVNNLDLTPSVLSLPPIVLLN